MALKKTPPGTGLESPFKSADRLYHEDRVKSENQKRFERWMDVIVRERRLPGDWREDPDTEAKVKWVDGKGGAPPAQKTPKGGKK